MPTTIRETSTRPLHPPSAIVRGNNTFMALAGTTLAAGTKYFVVIKTEDPTLGDAVLSTTNSSGEDGVTGWTIQNSRRFYQDGTWHSPSVSGSPFQIRVNGTNSETAPPHVTAAEVKTDGHSIVLTFNKNLDHPTYTTTIRSAFTVTVDGTGTSVQSTSGGMDKVNLSVSNTIAEGQTVVVSYDQSDAGTEALGDSDGNKVTDFTTGRGGIPAVDNNSEVDLSPPELTGATVTSSGVAIELAFDEDLDLPATIPAALKDAFSVIVDGDTVDISSLAADGSSGLQINLSSRILKDQAVVVSYDESDAGTNALDDAAGNEVADFTTGVGGVPAVDNDSTERSDDATLRELSVSIQNALGDGLVGVDLSPEFDPGIEMYSLSSVAFNRSQITFMPATNHTDATVAYFDGDDMALEDAGEGTSAINVGHQVSTAVGPNTVKVKVTAPDGTTPKTYTVTVTRELPTLYGSGAQVNGTTVLLQFQSDFPSGTGTLSAAAVAAFTVTADGVERPITGIALWVQDNFLDVTLSTPIYQGQAVVVSYDSAAALVDRYGDKFQSFTTGEDGVPAAANNSTATFPAPSTPTGFMAAPGDKRVTLSWAAPAATDPITRHEYQYKTDGDYPDDWKQIANSAPGGANEAGFTVTGLTNGTAYTFQLRAANPDNQSGEATSEEVTPVDTIPPMLSSATVNELGDLIVLDFSENLDRSAGGRPPESTFSVSVDGASIAVGDVAISSVFPKQVWFLELGRIIYQGQAVTVTYTDPTSGDDAAALQDAVGNDAGTFTTGEDGVPAVTNSSKQVAPPATPTGLTATASGGAQIDLSWSAPADGGSAITGYKIEVSEDGGSTWNNLVDNTRTTDTSYTHTGLAAGSTWHYRVSAINAGGTSDPSDVVSDTTAAICTENPGDEWCGVVTVGNRGSTSYGFIPAFGIAPVAGDLSDKTFDSYTIGGVWTGAGSTAGRLSFDLTSARVLTDADKVRLVLHVEGRSDGLAFSAATGPTVFNTYSWSGTGLDWSSEDYATLRLRQRTTGICGRTQKVQDEILRQLSGVSDCAAVTAAHLAGLPGTQDMSGLDIGSLKSGDFAGLTSVTSLDLSANSFTTLPPGVFSGLTALTDLRLAGGQLSSLPDGVFSGLTGLGFLKLEENNLIELPDGLFAGLTALRSLDLNDNRLKSLPGTLFSDTTLLDALFLHNNRLDELPDGLFFGLTALTSLDLSGNPSNPMLLTVTVEEAETGQVRAKVRAGAPFEVNIPVTVVNGTLDGGATGLRVEAGSVDGTPVTLTRTPGTTTTVDVDLTTQPKLPTKHTGYAFAWTRSDLSAVLPPFMPTSCTLNPGDVWCGTVTVGKVAEASGKTIGHGFHETWHGAGVGYMHDGGIVSGANSYRIDEAMVGVGATDQFDGFLFFSLDRAFSDADRARLVLHVGSAMFPLSEAHFESSTHTYHWRNTGLDWSSESSVTLRLQAGPAAPTAVTATAPDRTGGLLEVEWTAPALAGLIAGYEVKYWKAADPENENRRFRTARTESTETSLLLYALLDPGTEYTVRVRARTPSARARGRMWRRRAPGRSSRASRS